MTRNFGKRKREKKNRQINKNKLIKKEKMKENGKHETSLISTVTKSEPKPV